MGLTSFFRIYGRLCVLSGQYIVWILRVLVRKFLTRPTRKRGTSEIVNFGVEHGCAYVRKPTKRFASEVNDRGSSLSSLRNPRPARLSGSRHNPVADACQSTAHSPFALDARRILAHDLSLDSHDGTDWDPFVLQPPWSSLLEPCGQRSRLSRNTRCYTERNRVPPSTDRRPARKAELDNSCSLRPPSLVPVAHRRRSSGEPLLECQRTSRTEFSDERAYVHRQQQSQSLNLPPTRPAHALLPRTHPNDHNTTPNRHRLQRASWALTQ